MKSEYIFAVNLPSTTEQSERKHKAIKLRFHT